MDELEAVSDEMALYDVVDKMEFCRLRSIVVVFDTQKIEPLLRISS